MDYTKEPIGEKIYSRQNGRYLGNIQECPTCHRNVLVSETDGRRFFIHKESAAIKGKDTQGNIVEMVFEECPSQIIPEETPQSDQPK